jgi:response regulator RpfG family c-di-GMP phosphodiesterase
MLTVPGYHFPPADLIGYGILTVAYILSHTRLTSLAVFIYLVALLHDIGKMAIPDAILSKKTSLDDEWNGEGYPSGLRREEIPLPARSGGLDKTTGSAILKRSKR